MTPSMGKNADLMRAKKYGFWTATMTAPRVAVRWEQALHDDGRESLRGRNWVEVLPHGEQRIPRRYFAAEVETVGPNEWLTYYPAIDEPVCGWGRPRLPEGEMQYCPRFREENEPFCRLHMAELNEERNLNAAVEHGAEREPVPASDGSADPVGHAGDGE